MPREEIFKKFKAGTLRSSTGQKVTDRKQAIAIAMQYKPEGGGRKTSGKRG